MSMKVTKEQFIGVTYEELLAENAKLRNDLEDANNQAEEVCIENAKLRELCKAWREFAYEIFDECFGEPELNEDFMKLDDRMEALGIEVDE